MEDMSITIGTFDPATRTVPVTFVRGDVIHERAVNAVLDEDGAYDAEATAERVDEVARGVACKVDAGAITNPPPAIELPVLPPPEPDLEPLPAPGD
jgi:hypothetical protein